MMSKPDGWNDTLMTLLLDLHELPLTGACPQQVRPKTVSFLLYVNSFVPLLSIWWHLVFVACDRGGFISGMSHPAGSTVHRAFNQGGMGAKAMLVVNMPLWPDPCFPLSVWHYALARQPPASSYVAFPKRLGFFPPLCSLSVVLRCGSLSLTLINSILLKGLLMKRLRK